MPQYHSEMSQTVLCSRQGPCIPVFAMKLSIKVYKGQSSSLVLASSVNRLAGELRFFHTSCHHLQPVQKIMWPLGCAVLLKHVSTSTFGSLCVSLSVKRLALHGATLIVRLFLWLLKKTQMKWQKSSLNAFKNHVKWYSNWLLLF